MKSDRQYRPYGLWQSPITPAHFSSSLGFGDLIWDQTGALVWSETRSDRTALVVLPGDGSPRRDVNRRYSTRGRVHYGGGEFTTHAGEIYFVEAASARIYRQSLAGGLAKPITPGFGGAAAPRVSPDGEWVVYVHSYEGRDSLAVGDTAGKFWPQKLVEGADFYMQPVWHPAGRMLAWIAWDQPRMPWDGSTLYLGRLEAAEGSGLPVLAQTDRIAGEDEVAVFQPAFSPDGRYLAYVSDESGWWQIYVYDLESGRRRQLTFEPAEHGLPAWNQGLRTYSFAPGGESLYVVRNKNGTGSLWQVQLESGHSHQVDLPSRYTWLEKPAAGPVGDRIALVASGTDQPPEILLIDPEGGPRLIQLSTLPEIPAKYFTPGQAISWQSPDRATVHGLFFQPAGELSSSRQLPPLLVMVHGGPTSQRTLSFNWEVQYFTSRGYAVLQVNYRGSTGYGRKYRNLLRGKWGIYDVQDAVSGARYLADNRQVDGARMAIMGGSAGGYTVLRCLQEYPGEFKAGICLYGVATHLEFSADMPKFEAHYTEQLLGPFPEAAELYRELSPVFATEKLTTPLALFQGEDDPVVPRSHSDRIAAALRRNQTTHIYHVYPGEGHGFRQPETIRHVYTEIINFLTDYLLF